MLEDYFYGYKGDDEWYIVQCYEDRKEPCMVLVHWYARLGDYWTTAYVGTYKQCVDYCINMEVTPA